MAHPFPNLPSQEQIDAESADSDWSTEALFVARHSMAILALLGLCVILVAVCA